MGFVGDIDDAVIAKLMEQLGNIVHDIYSPPRVTLELSRSGRAKFPGLVVGVAMDLTVKNPDDNRPWDFSLRLQRDKVRNFVRQTKPILLIGSPMCTAFSTWQRLTQRRCEGPTFRHARAWNS